MSYQKVVAYFFFIVLVFLNNSIFSQNLKQEKMENLNYLIGEWVGTSKIYENGVLVKQGSAYEYISYDLDKNILVIELNTEFLQLHTIILYDENDQKYYYHRFSKNGAARYSAEFKDGQLIVWKDDKTRFFFRNTPDGGFQERGEQLINGKWIITFEDTFVNTQ
ncbi:hypothetical protein [Fulvivirga sedimenti]|uniref:DUF1579 domain-containing protein n=1 Tax=Fulvivirga sedimenti TaxID=2879465 RepID=A0A9X1HVP9_9BACT|nr:hypothetical protein [Fulvivirga sedimenti]MCA6075019.1 hypothetical protein [Fulvivirga sedimenti]MCA6076196.1 hypothetical protein [Fulvivirga sedimenti]MCA6077324.1 hypothetical protein [Fulvivirga sedimenti]